MWCMASQKGRKRWPLKRGASVGSRAANVGHRTSYRKRWPPYGSVSERQALVAAKRVNKRVFPHPGGGLLCRSFGGLETATAARPCRFTPLGGTRDCLHDCAHERSLCASRVLRRSRHRAARSVFGGRVGCFGLFLGRLGPFREVASQKGRKRWPLKRAASVGLSNRAQALAPGPQTLATAHPTANVGPPTALFPPGGG